MPLLGILMITSLAAIALGWFWTIALAFQKSIFLGFFCMIWPASIAFGLMDSRATRLPALVGLFGVALGFWTGLFGSLNN
jgi:hypothetical protein